MASTSVDANTLLLGLGGLAAGVLGVQKLWKQFRVTDAETAVVKLMHVELERMAALNTKLAVELGTFQMKIVELNNEIVELRSENANFKSKISQLEEQIETLKRHKDI